MSKAKTKAEIRAIARKVALQAQARTGLPATREGLLTFIRKTAPSDMRRLGRPFGIVAPSEINLLLTALDIEWIRPASAQERLDAFNG